MEFLHKKARRVSALLRWLLLAVPKNPRLELYMRWMDMSHSRALKQMRRDPDGYAKRYFESYTQPDFPKIIWLYWNSGAQNAPFLVQQCIASWRDKNPGWDVRVTHDAGLPEGVSLDDVPAFYEPVKRANVLRLRLLKRYGGVWCDATVYCHRPLDEYLDLMSTTGFFCLRDDGPSRHYSNWFMACAPEDEIISALERLYNKTISTSRFKSDIWFTFFYTHQWTVRRNPKLARRLADASTLQARPSFFMMAALRGQISEDRFFEMVDCGLPVSKLDYKSKVSEAQIGRLMAQADARSKNQTADSRHRSAR